MLAWLSSFLKYNTAIGSRPAKRLLLLQLAFKLLYSLSQQPNHGVLLAYLEFQLELEFSDTRLESLLFALLLLFAFLFAHLPSGAKPLVTMLDPASRPRNRGVRLTI